MAKRRTGYLIKRGRIYYACWTVAGKKFMQTTGHADRRKAESRLSEIMEPFLVENEVKTLESVRSHIEGAKARLEALAEDRNPPLILPNVWDTYKQSQNRHDTGPATLLQYEVQWGRFLKWMSTQHPTTTAMRDVSGDMAAEFIQYLVEEKRTAGTQNKYITFLRYVFHVLADKAKIERNPFEKIEPKTAAPESRRELTLDELKRVCQRAEGDLRLLLALGIYTGLRLGDCATLTWGEIDLRRHVIRRVPSKTARRHPGKVVQVPIHPVLHVMLSEIPAAKRTGYLLPRIAADHKQHASYVTDRVQAHFNACGIRTVRATPDRAYAVVEVGFHSLRHSFVSLCRAADAPLAVVEAIVGHSNPAMTRHYTHVGELAATQAVAALPSVFGDAKMLPASAAAQPVDRAVIRVLAKKLGAKTWPQVKAELLTLAGGT